VIAVDLTVDVLMGTDTIGTVLRSLTLAILLGVLGRACVSSRPFSAVREESTNLVLGLEIGVGGKVGSVDFFGGEGLSLGMAERSGLRGVWRAGEVIGVIINVGGFGVAQSVLNAPAVPSSVIWNLSRWDRSMACGDGEDGKSRRSSSLSMSLFLDRNC